MSKLNQIPALSTVMLLMTLAVITFLLTLQLTEWVVA